jgi:hypothetical protein
MKWCLLADEMELFWVDEMVDGRRKSQCKDCGTGYCEHGRQKGNCKDCGTGYCVHGRQKSACRGCSPRSSCEHGRKEQKCSIKKNLGRNSGRTSLTSCNLRSYVQ